MARWLLPVLASLIVTFTAQAEDRFTRHPDETVTDTRTGLTWSMNDNQGDISWEDANRWCRYLFPTVAKGDGWRLPTVAELKTLVDKNGPIRETDCGEAAHILAPFTLTCPLVWSSERFLGTPTLFHFGIGAPVTASMADTTGCRSLAVRSAPQP